MVDRTNFPKVRVLGGNNYLRGDSHPKLHSTSCIMGLLQTTPLAISTGREKKHFLTQEQTHLFSFDLKTY